MANSIRLISFFTLLLIPCILFAQEELEELYIPPANSILGKSGDDENDKNKGSRSYPNYSIRFIPTTLARNIISFEFEKTMSESVSFGFIGGYCLGKSYIQTNTINMRELTENSDYLNVDQMLIYSDPDGGGATIGLYLRIYIDSYFGSGDKFWEIQYRNWSYGYDLDYIDPVVGNSRGRLSNNFIGILWGMQTLTGKQDTFIIDSKIGFGMNLVKYDSFERNNEFGFDYPYYSKSVEEQYFAPMFYYSLALGYAKYSK